MNDKVPNATAKAAPNREGLDAEASESEREGYTKVYMGSGGEDDGVYSDEDVDQCEEEGDNVPERCLYAVRRGTSVKNCIFLFWDDCAAQIEDCDEAEYEVFTLFQDATVYLMSSETEKQKKTNRRSKKRRGEDEEDDAAEGALKAHEKAWEGMYEQLKEFQKEHCHTLVPHDYENKTLYNWVHKQRREGRRMREGARTSMTQERLQKLEALDFSFNPVEARRAMKLEVSETATKMMENSLGAADTDRPPEVDKRQQKWESMFAALQEYRNEFGNCFVPRGPKAGSLRQLGFWAQHQRRLYKDFESGKPSSLTQEKVDRLKSLGFVFTNTSEARKSIGSTDVSGDSEKVPARKEGKREEAWETLYSELKTFRDEFGHCLVPAPLRRWSLPKKVGVMLKIGLEAFEYGAPGPSLMPSHAPHLPAYCWREYGHLRGSHRLAAWLGANKAPHALVVSSRLFAQHPEALRPYTRLATSDVPQDWVAHSTHQQLHASMDTAAEEDALRECALQWAGSGVERAPQVWCSPMLAPSADTYRLVEKHLHCSAVWDLYADDEPVVVRNSEPSSEVVSLPLTWSGNDLPFQLGGGTATQFVQQVQDTLETLQREGTAERPKLMTLSLHPWVTCSAAWWPHVERLLISIVGNSDVALVTPSQVLERCEK